MSDETKRRQDEWHALVALVAERDRLRERVGALEAEAEAPCTCCQRAQRAEAKLERVRALTALEPHNQSRPSMVLTAHIDAALADEKPSDGA